MMYFNNVCICQGAPQAAIRKAYRELTLVRHPDKPTGNAKAFMKLAKGT